jgi:5-oxopent-3-ene-1,2,5-tricarboxylate decarboxylase / 2-hydroxyhepta-2,4-diene-1,7-dioate isomerase
MTKPERLAWFYHRGQQERRLGVFDPGPGLFLDRGPVDERKALACGQLMDRAWLLDGAKPMPNDPVFDIPVAHPGKLLCLGKNYAAHAHEFGADVHEEPIFFTKFHDTMIPHGAPIVLPHWVDTRIDHEIEVGVILGFDDPDGRGRKYVDADAAMDLVAGYTILNDVTARTMQVDDRDLKHPWVRSKSFDTFCPIGPWVIPRGELPEIDELTIRLHVNDEKRQESSTKLMVTDIPHAIEFLSKHTTLRPGDILATGTPEGVGPIVAGDTVTCFVERIGTLQNPVIREEPPA